MCTVYDACSKKPTFSKKPNKMLLVFYDIALLAFYRFVKSMANTLQ